MQIVNFQNPCFVFCAPGITINRVPSPAGSNLAQCVRHDMKCKEFSSVWGFLPVFLLRVTLIRILCIQECESRKAEKCHVQENQARRKAIL